MLQLIVHSYLALALIAVLVSNVHVYPVDLLHLPYSFPSLILRRHRFAILLCVIPSVALRFLLTKFLSAGYLSPSDKIVDCFGDSVSLFTGLLLISGIWRLTYSFVVQLS